MREERVQSLPGARGPKRGGNVEKPTGEKSFREVGSSIVGVWERDVLWFELHVKVVPRRAEVGNPSVNAPKCPRGRTLVAWKKVRQYSLDKMRDNEKPPDKRQTICLSAFNHLNESSTS